MLSGNGSIPIEKWPCQFGTSRKTTPPRAIDYRLLRRALAPPVSSPEQLCFVRPCQESCMLKREQKSIQNKPTSAWRVEVSQFTCSLNVHMFTVHMFTVHCSHFTCSLLANCSVFTRCCSLHHLYSTCQFTQIILAHSQGSHDSSLFCSLRLFLIFAIIITRTSKVDLSCLKDSNPQCTGIYPGEDRYLASSHT